MRGAATKSMSDIVEDRQRSRYAPFAAAPLRAAARRPAGFVARSSHTAPGIARRSRLASGNCGTQPWGPAAKCEFISARALRLPRSHGEKLATNFANYTKAGQASIADSRLIRGIRGKW